MTSRRALLALSLGTMIWPRSSSAQSVDLVIRVEMSTDRDQIGSLSLETAGGRRLAGPFSAYGRSDNRAAGAHGNPTRDPVRPFGDTPTGSYAVPRAVATGPGTAYVPRSYGPNGALVLKPTGGQAAQAAANGRVGLLIHGGDPGTAGRLRATHGCIRLSNADMAALMAAIISAGENARFQRCDITRINATVGPVGDIVSGEDVGDPPPGIEALLGNGPIRLP